MGVFRRKRSLISVFRTDAKVAAELSRLNDNLEAVMLKFGIEQLPTEDEVVSARYDKVSVSNIDEEEDAVREWLVDKGYVQPDWKPIDAEDDENTD